MATANQAYVYCPQPFFDVAYYSTLQNAYYNVSPTYIRIYTNGNAWATDQRVYSDRWRTANAPIAWYRYNNEIREGYVGFDVIDSIAYPRTVFAGVNSSVPYPPAGMRAIEADYCDNGWWMWGYYDGYGGYYYDWSGTFC